MATTSTHISVDQYLHTVYEPDCDYVDGEIEERALGEYDHATWQAILIAFFTMRQSEWGIKARPELRIQVASQRFRVPDVCLLSRETPTEQVITHPPLAVFEILSPEDRMIRVTDRLADYESMGVGAIWLIDPRQPTYYRYASGQLTPASVFYLPGTGHKVEMSEIAALID
jgi:Uma2 family endonuclease